MGVLPLIFKVLVGGGVEVQGITEGCKVGGARTLVVFLGVLNPLLLELGYIEHG